MVENLYLFREVIDEWDFELADGVGLHVLTEILIGEWEREWLARKSEKFKMERAVSAATVVLFI